MEPPVLSRGTAVRPQKTQKYTKTERQKNRLSRGWLPRSIVFRDFSCFSWLTMIAEF
jgi:hypothetical protein